MSADVELVGNFCVEGVSVPFIGSGFTLNATREILENADSTTFLSRNEILRHGNLVPDGLSLRTQVKFTCALRSGCESEDLISAAENFTAKLDQIAFACIDKRILLRNGMDEKSLNSYPFNEFSRGSLQHKVNMPINAISDQKMVPLVRITRDETMYSRLSTTLEVIVPAVFGDNSYVLYNRLIEGVRRKIHSMVYVMLDGFKNQKKLLPPISQVFFPPGWSSLLHLQILNCEESEQHSLRVKFHKLLNLSLSVPCIRCAQAITFAPTSILRSPHLYITSYKPRSKVSVVKGDYFYYHYMQGGVNDTGWGCAYRSLQSIWSWFNLNGFTDKPVPTHLEIQQCLVDIKDKKREFLGSRQWIGSTEIGYVLDHLLGIQSHYIVTNSGIEVLERARELAVHFEVVGTPVMIGGAQLAHTILGVDFDQDSGDCNFLVLDPHYTGSEDLKAVLEKGYCAWKAASFWNPAYFYNMILPQIPKIDI
ncbi:peptidase family C78 [Dictyocaulus viviparus]|uniref:Ufm1-specific protease n=1 Tax=Dictyocaulus viviparus TaxID=29172 RepID=A0A0D8XX64_DICVI|nr:peptidase family C78 [Dictyocaulus viviparus]